MYLSETVIFTKDFYLFSVVIEPVYHIGVAAFATFRIIIQKSTASEKNFSKRRSFFFYHLKSYERGKMIPQYV